MRYSPSSRDLEDLAATLRVLLSPLAYDDRDSWARAAMRGLRRLLRADRGHMMLEGTFLAEMEPAAVAEYDAYYRRLDVAPQIAHRRGLEVSSYEELFGREALFASEYYNDYLEPHRIHRLHGLGFHYEADGLPSYSFLTASVTDRSRTAIEERAPVLLPLLLPAFKAGVRTAVAHERRRRSLAAILDRVGERLALCDAEGRTRHANAALEELLAAEPDRERLRRAIRRAARGLVALRNRRRALGRGLPEVGERELRTHRGPYRLRATYLGSHLFPPAEVLVEVEPLFRIPLGDRELHDAFGLTRREREVARLLGRGHSNRKVAEALGISPHTARRHTESVLRKLGVSSRAQVADRITRG